MKYNSSNLGAYLIKYNIGDISSSWKAMNMGTFFLSKNLYIFLFIYSLPFNSQSYLYIL